MPQQNPVQNLFSAVSDLIDFAVPLLIEAYAFSQVLGHALKAMNPEANGPPPTYYIGLPPANPSAPNQPAPPPNGTAVTQVAAIGIDQAGGLVVQGPNYQVLIGSGQNPVAVMSLAMVGNNPLQTANYEIRIGPLQLPLAGQGAVTANGPVIDQSPDGVAMAVTAQMGGIPGKHTLYNLCGTGGRWDADFTADICRVVQDQSPRYYWQGVSYPAQLAAMGPSVKQGVDELVRLISDIPGTFAFIGYSLGAVVSCKVWRDEILNPAGRLHDRLDDIFAHVTFGNPMRCPGWANGNGLANLPPIVDEFGYQTGGIAGPDDLTPWQTMWWHADFAKNGDLYACCPTGPDPWSNEAPPGEMETAIYKMMMYELTGQESILQQVGEILTDPFNELVPLILAIVDGIQFLSDMGTHAYGECFWPAVDFLKARGAQTPVGS